MFPFCRAAGVVTLLIASAVSHSQCFANDYRMSEFQNQSNADGSDFDSDAVLTSGSGGWTAGVDLVFVRPQFESNIAFTRTESNGISVATIADVEFEHGFSLTTRPWIAYETIDSVGLRASFFRLDDGSSVLATRPPANGFGRIDHPAFGAVNISSTVPTESLRFQSVLELYAID